MDFLAISLLILKSAFGLLGVTAFVFALRTEGVTSQRYMIIGLLAVIAARMP